MSSGCLSDLATQTPTLLAIMVFKRVRHPGSGAVLEPCGEAYNLEPGPHLVDLLQRIALDAMEPYMSFVDEGLINIHRVIPIADGIQAFWNQSPDRSVVVILLASSSYPSALAFQTSDNIHCDMSFEQATSATVNGSRSLLELHLLLSQSLAVARSVDEVRDAASTQE